MTPEVSVVIPVFNSAAIVGDTIDRTVAFFRSHGLAVEVVCVNDGSRDDSWQVLRRKAAEHPEVVGLNLLRNYGQHNANLCGFRHARGDWIVTLDAARQNPPAQIPTLPVPAAAACAGFLLAGFHRRLAAVHRRRPPPQPPGPDPPPRGRCRRSARPASSPPG